MAASFLLFLQFFAEKNRFHGERPFRDHGLAFFQTPEDFDSAIA
jgi:hypothetical protein